MDPHKKYIILRKKNFPVGNEAQEPNIATAILPPMGAQPNVPQMDADSFYASFLISILYPNCNDDKVNEGYCHWENVTDDAGAVIDQVGMMHKEVTLMNNKNGLTIQKTVQRSEKKFGSAANHNEKPVLLEEKIEIFQNLGDGCMEQDRYQSFAMYRFDILQGGKPVGVDVDEGGYLLCKSSSSVSGNDQAIPCGYPVAELVGPRVRSELLDQFTHMKEINIIDNNRRLKKRKLQDSNTIKSRSKIYERLPQIFAKKNKMPNQADQAAMHFKRALGFDDVVDTVAYLQKDTENVLLEMCENEVSDVAYARRLEYRLHAHGKGFKHLKRVSPLGHMIHATKRHLKDVHKKLKVIHKKLKVKHGRKLGYGEAVTQFQEHLFSIDESLRNVRLNETTEESILTSLFDMKPGAFASDQMATTANLFVEYYIRKINMEKRKMEHEMKEQNVCALQKSEATETDKGAWGKAFDSAVGQEVRAEMEYQNAKAHFEEVVSYIETIYVLQQYPEKVQNVKHIMDALENDVLADYENFVYLCSINNDCTNEQKDEEKKKMKHMSTTIHRLHKVVDSIKAIAIDAKKPASTCEYMMAISAENGGHGWTYLHNLKYFDGEEENLHLLMESFIPYMERDTNTWFFTFPEEWSNAAEESMVSYEEEKEESSVSDEEHMVALLDKKEALKATCQNSCLPTIVEYNFLSYPQVSASSSCECAKYCSDTAKAYKALKAQNKKDALEKMRKFQTNYDEENSQPECLSNAYRVVSQFSVNAAILKNSQAVRWQHNTNQLNANNYGLYTCNKNIDCHNIDASFNTQTFNQGDSRIRCVDSSNAMNPSYNKKVLIPKQYMKSTIQHKNNGGCLKYVESTGGVAMSTECNEDDQNQVWIVGDNNFVKSANKDVNGNYRCLTTSTDKTALEFNDQDQYLQLNDCNVNDPNQSK